MLTSKQRSRLMGLSAKLPTTMNIGKNGVGEGVLDKLDELLNRYELVKVGVLKNSGTTAKDLINELADTLGAEPVHAIGGKIILYRYSTAEGVEHVALDEETARRNEREKEREAKKQEATKREAKKAALAKPYRPEKKHGVHKGKGSKPTKKK
ncbi:MAG: YhbY family RNA-binding protein [Clostridia bacterium]|nr:YhbY family RNA-binding protein [Clostridia bacterium]